MKLKPESYIWKSVWILANAIFNRVKFQQNTNQTFAQLFKINCIILENSQVSASEYLYLNPDSYTHRWYWAPMNHSTPGLPVHHQLPEFTQTHVHRVNDTIQPSHPLSSPFFLLPIPPSIRVFSNESTLPMRWPKYWSFSFSIIPSKEHPGLISFRMD